MKRLSIHTISTIVAACFALTACDSGNDDADVKADAAKADTAKDKDKDKKPDATADKKPDAKADTKADKKPDAADGPKMTHVAMAQHEVADFAKWKTAYDAGADMRKEAGGTMGDFVFQDLENPNMVSVLLGGTQPDKFKAMLGSPDMKKAMTDAGVKGEPEVSIWELKDQSPEGDMSTYQGTVLIRHEVESWDGFKAAFASGAEMMAGAGVIGWGTAVNLDNANEVGVRLDTSDMEKTKAFMASDELKAKMKEGGVKGEPTIAFMKLVMPPAAAAAGTKADAKADGAPAEAPAEKKAG